MLSVLMAVWEGDDSVRFRAALESVWTNQSVKPTQIVIVADGKIPESLQAVVQNFEKKCPCLCFISLKKNVGLGEALNAGIKACRFDLVARMDADDIAYPTRFAQQIAFMEANEKVAASSSFVEEVDDNENVLGIRRVPIGDKAILRAAKWRTVLNHPSTILRKSCVLAVGGYPSFRKAQDFGLWSKLIARGYVLDNVPDVLLRMNVAREFGKRRGSEQLYWELRVIKLQKTLKVLEWYEWPLAFAFRLGLRSTPFFLKSALYGLRRLI